MIVDASAIVAIALDEEPASRLIEALISARRPAVSAATLFEAMIVIDARGPIASRRLDVLLADVDLEVVPFTTDHTALARQAYRDFGRGSGHPARLNFGDCLTYALAAARGEALLYVGDDFAHTDLRSALEE